MESFKKQLLNLYERYPKRAPLKDVAELLGMNEESLKTAVQSGKVPFAIGYQTKTGGNRVSVIPTMTFLIWFTQGEIFKMMR